MRQFGFEIRTLRSQFPGKLRHANISEFNDPESNVEVLVTSTMLSSAGLNLQRSCHHMLIVEPAPTISLTMQIIGRVHRLGQMHNARIEQILLNESFDDFVLARAFRAHVFTWAAETPLAKHFDGMGDVLMIIGAELSRAFLGLPYVPWQVDRTSWPQNRVAREFAIALRPHAIQLLDLEKAKEFSEDLKLAAGLREHTLKRIRKIKATRAQVPEPIQAAWKKCAGTVGGTNAPYLASEFRLTSGEGMPYLSYRIPSAALGDAMLHVVYYFMDKFASEYLMARDLRRGDEREDSPPGGSERPGDDLTAGADAIQDTPMQDAPPRETPMQDAGAQQETGRVLRKRNLAEAEDDSGTREDAVDGSAGDEVEKKRKKQRKLRSNAGAGKKGKNA
jgi:Helicase conserved C-terminal domain